MADSTGSASSRSGFGARNPRRQARIPLPVVWAAVGGSTDLAALTAPTQAAPSTVRRLTRLGLMTTDGQPTEAGRLCTAMTGAHLRPRDLRTYATVALLAHAGTVPHTEVAARLQTGTDPRPLRASLERLVAAGALIRTERSYRPAEISGRYASVPAWIVERGSWQAVAMAAALDRLGRGDEYAGGWDRRWDGTELETGLTAYLGLGRATVARWLAELAAIGGITRAGGYRGRRAEYQIVRENPSGNPSWNPSAKGSRGGKFETLSGGETETHSRENRDPIPGKNETPYEPVPNRNQGFLDRNLSTPTIRRSGAPAGPAGSQSSPAQEPRPGLARLARATESAVTRRRRGGSHDHSRQPGDAKAPAPAVAIPLVGAEPGQHRDDAAASRDGTATPPPGSGRPPSPPARAASRSRGAAWDALAEETGFVGAAGSAAGRLGKALKDIRAMSEGLSLDELATEIRVRAARYRRLNNYRITPTALAAQWPALAADPPPREAIGNSTIGDFTGIKSGRVAL